MAIPIWKLKLNPASFRGANFHVELNARSGGRRIALHEFPKKDKPYAEDMGRKARHFTVTAYVIGANYEDDRDALIRALEVDGPGQLIHPTYTQYDQVAVDNYSVTERREQGGYAVFDISFVEAGQNLFEQQTSDSQSGVTGAVDNAVPSSSSLNGNDFTGSSDITGLG